MRRRLTRLAFAVLGTCVCLSTAGCSDTLGVAYPSLAGIQKLSNTVLTAKERDEAIRELQEEQDKQNKEAKK